MVDAVVYTLKAADRVLDCEPSAGGRSRSATRGKASLMMMHLGWRGAVADWGTTVVACRGRAWGRGAWWWETGHAGGGGGGGAGRVQSSSIWLSGRRRRLLLFSTRRLGVTVPELPGFQSAPVCSVYRFTGISSIASMRLPTRPDSISISTPTTIDPSFDCPSFTPSRPGRVICFTSRYSPQIRMNRRMFRNVGSAFSHCRSKPTLCSSVKSGSSVETV